MPTITPLKSLPLSRSRLWQLSLHPSKPLLTAASSDKSAYLASLSTFTSLSTVEGGHKRTVRTVSFRPGPASEEEETLATGSFDGTAGIWRGSALRDEQREEADEEEEEWRFVVVLEGHDSEVKGVAWSAGGNLFATCSRDKSVWIWEDMGEDNYETVAVLQEHDQDVKAVKWHPEEELLASCSYDDTIRLYREDVDDWECVAVLQGHTATVWKIDFENTPSSSKDRLVSCSDDLSIRVWKRTKRGAPERGAAPSILRSNRMEENWEEESILPKAHTRPIYSVAWSPVSGRVVSCGGDNKIVVYEEKVVEGEEGKKEWTVIAELENAHGVYEVNDVAWSKRWDKDRKSEEEEMIVSAGDDGAVNFYALE